VTPEIRRIDSGDNAGIDAYCEVRNAVWPDDGDSPAQVAWEDATYPGQVVRFLARADGKVVGSATTGRLHIYGPEHPRWYLGIWVLPHARLRGVGSALWHATSDAARTAGKDGLQCWISEADDAGCGFLRHRGFEVVGRDKSVGLRLAGRTRPTPDTPPGFVITDLDARPELVAGVHRAALEAYPAIPSATPLDPGPLDEFVAREVERDGVPRDGFKIAVDTASGTVAGYASVKFAPGTPTIGWHEMTAVRPGYRGLGLATALKQATIAWAIDRGLEALHTGNDERNAPMRAVNAKLGYTPLADFLAFRGPLAPAR
jgi:GNAT superfamily N-acetyltransferase